MSTLRSYRLQILGHAPARWIGVVLLIFLGLLSLSQTARADIYVAEDDFEDHDESPSGHGWLDEWQFEGDAGIVDDSGAYDGSANLRLSGRDASAVRSTEVTGEEALRLRFWARAGDLLPNSCVIEVSGDGDHYVPVEEWSNGDESDEYAFFDLDLGSTGISFENQFWIRARVLGNRPDSGVLEIDDLRVVNAESDPEVADAGDSEIVLDGQFSDWTGKAMLTDPSGDQDGPVRYDLATFYWANNIDEEINFHMLERHTTDGLPYNGENGQRSLARYTVYIDTDNDGNFRESNDRRAVVTYVPRRDSSLVKVQVYPANSGRKISDSGWHDWGDSRAEGGLRVEFMLDWNDLGIEFGGVIRMYVVSFSGLSVNPRVVDRLPDGEADIQWSPASVLGPWLLAAASFAGIGVIWYLSRRRRLWT